MSSTRSTLNFFSPSMSDLCSQIDRRVVYLQHLYTKGFRETYKACEYLRLGREIGYLNITPLVKQPYENLYRVKFTPLLCDMIKTLRDELDNIKSNISSNNSLIDPYLSLSDYVSFFRKKETDEIRRLELTNEIDYLMKKASLNLVKPSSD